MNLSNIEERQGKSTDASIWIEYDGSKILIAPARGTKYNQALNNAMRKGDPRKVYKNAELNKKATIEAMVQSVVIDWKDVFDGPKHNQKQVPFTKEGARRMLECDEVREFIFEQASDIDNFIQEGVLSADIADLKSVPDLGA